MVRYCVLSSKPGIKEFIEKTYRKYITTDIKITKGDEPNEYEICAELLNPDKRNIFDEATSYLASISLDEKFTAPMLVPFWTNISNNKGLFYYDPKTDFLNSTLLSTGIISNKQIEYNPSYIEEIPLRLYARFLNSKSKRKLIDDTFKTNFWRSARKKYFSSKFPFLSLDDINFEDIKDKIKDYDKNNESIDTFLYNKYGTITIDGIKRRVIPFSLPHASIISEGYDRGTIRPGITPNDVVLNLMPNDPLPPKYEKSKRVYVPGTQWSAKWLDSRGADSKYDYAFIEFDYDIDEDIKMKTTTSLTTPVIHQEAGFSMMTSPIIQQTPILSSMDLAMNKCIEDSMKATWMMSFISKSKRVEFLVLKKEGNKFLEPYVTDDEMLAADYSSTGWFKANRNWYEKMCQTAERNYMPGVIGYKIFQSSEIIVETIEMFEAWKTWKKHNINPKLLSSSPIYSKDITPSKSPLKTSLISHVQITTPPPSYQTPILSRITPLPLTKPSTGIRKVIFEEPQEIESEEEIEEVQEEEQREPEEGGFYGGAEEGEDGEPNGGEEEELQEFGGEEEEPYRGSKGGKEIKKVHLIYEKEDDELDTDDIWSFEYAKKIQKYLTPEEIKYMPLGWYMSRADQWKIINKICHNRYVTKRSRDNELYGIPEDIEKVTDNVLRKVADACSLALDRSISVPNGPIVDKFVCSNIINYANDRGV